MIEGLGLSSLGNIKRRIETAHSATGARARSRSYHCVSPDTELYLQSSNYAMALVAAAAASAASAIAAIAATWTSGDDSCSHLSTKSISLSHDTTPPDQPVMGRLGRLCRRALPGVYRCCHRLSACCCAYGQINHVDLRGPEPPRLCSCNRCCDQQKCTEKRADAIHEACGWCN